MDSDEATKAEIHEITKKATVEEQGSNDLGFRKLCFPLSSFIMAYVAQERLAQERLRAQTDIPSALEKALNTELGKGDRQLQEEALGFQKPTHAG